MNKKTIFDLNQNDIENKKVLIRVDFNVPIDDNKNITDDTRIKAALETINYLRDNNAKIILSAHFGRPKGKVNPDFSLKPIVEEFNKITGYNCTLAPDCIGEEVEKMISEMKNQDIILLENVRFHKEETDNDPEFAKKLASLADLYVNDAFGAAHRAHASTEGVAKHLPAYAGALMKKEIEFLSQTVENPKRPFVAIIGGAKVSTKLSVLKNLVKKVDKLLIGGGMAYTFFKALGLEIGKSLCEDDLIEEAKEFLEAIKNEKTEVVFPVDNIIAQDIKEGTETKVVAFNEIPADWEGLDIGPKTQEMFIEKLQGAKTIVWNGPVGLFEISTFAEGTNAIAKVVAESGAVTIIGGGDSISAIKKAGLSDKITHMSTGGGASLEMLEGKELPGLAALLDT
ncbi:phosphoglycerate kinase [Candidatus Margulisiibacteriota bacterium]